MGASVVFVNRDHALIAVLGVFHLREAAPSLGDDPVREVTAVELQHLVRGVGRAVFGGDDAELFVGGTDIDIKAGYTIAIAVLANRAWIDRHSHPLGVQTRALADLHRSEWR